MARPTDTVRPRGVDELDVSVRRRLIARSALVGVTGVAAVVVTYFVLPWDGGGTSSVVVRVLIALGVLATATVMAVTHVLHAEYPVLRAVESLAAVVSLTIVTFASIYVVMSSDDGAAFSEPLDRIDALYFAMTTATTVGFGDIHARSDAARIVVMIQMVVNVVLLGAVVRVVLDTARRRIGR